MRWVILTGEYPPHFGGVSDYTAALAESLVRSGDAVDVFVPGPDPGDPSHPGGPTVHWVPNHYGPTGCRTIESAIKELTDRCIVLIQYVPQSFGIKGMNLYFCRWVASLACPVWVMFHEVWIPVSFKQPWQHSLIGMANWLMARILARSADRIFYSCLAWLPRLDSVARPWTPRTWLPVPTTIADASAARPPARDRGRVRLGHFGTYGGPLAGTLEAACRLLLQQDSQLEIVLIGRGSTEFREACVQRHPTLHARLHETGGQTPEGVETAILCCDAMLQPYPDGITTRRTTAMAGLALGVPVITNLGPHTEPVWSESQSVVLSPSFEVSDLVSTVQGFLATGMAGDFGRRGGELYERCFSLDNSIRVLRGQAAEDAQTSKGCSGG